MVTFTDERGTLTVVDPPFEVKRIFWIYDCVAPRGGHAHKNCWQAFIAFGRAAIMVGPEMHVPQPYVEMVIVPPGNVVTITMPRESCVLVLCSESYDKEDYIECAIP